MSCREFAMSLISRAYFGSHSMVSHGREPTAARKALLIWMISL